MDERLEETSVPSGDEANRARQEAALPGAQAGPERRQFDARREATLRWLRGEAEREGDFRRLAQAVCSHLYRDYEHYSWVGIYMIEGDRLKLWAWDGPQPTQHVEIPLNAGLCGWAASTGQIANVPDVSKDDRYLQCFASCKSEIVVPIAHNGRVFGEIDIDGDALAAFDEGDERFLSDVCAVLAARFAEEPGLDPGHGAGGR